MTLLGRAALGFVIIAAAVVVLYSASLITLMRAAYQNQIDELLHHDFEYASIALYRDAIGGVAWREAQHFHEHEEVEADVLVRDATGRPVFSRQKLSRGEPLDFAKLPMGYHTLPDGARVLSSLIRIGNAEYVIHLLRDQRSAEQQSKLLTYRMAVAGAVALIASALLGLWLARRVLEPVRQLTARAQQIDAERLSDRLPVPAGDVEMAALANAFNRAFDRISDNFDRLNRFTADAAHELRSPLAALRVTAEVALQEKDANAITEALRRALEQAERMGRLIERMLALARADAGTVEVTGRIVSARDILKDAAELFEPLAHQRGQIITVVADAAHTLWGDRDLALQALMDVLDNAIKFSGSGNRIQLASALTGDRCELTCTDEGVGMDDEAIARAGERLFRADKARQRHDRSGHGLGLAIAAALCRAQSGELRIERPVTGGLRVRLLMPRTRPPESPAPAIRP